jgi:hypothetical protein
VTFRRLTRYFRLYEKKRGDRRSGSAALGTAWMTVFFAGLFFVGWCFLAVTFTMTALPEWQAYRRFRETTCEVIATRIENGDRSGRTTYRPMFLLRYQAGGESYQGWQTSDITGGFFLDRTRCDDVLQNYRPGNTYPCWFDPHKPQVAVLEVRLSNYVWLMLLLPSGLIIVGGAGLAWRLFNWRTSAERRASLAVGQQVSHAARTALLVESFHTFRPRAA